MTIKTNLGTTLELSRRRIYLQVAKNLTKVTQLIKAGFEYVTEIENMKLYRKIK